MPTNTHQYQGTVTHQHRSEKEARVQEARVQQARVEGVGQARGMFAEAGHVHPWAHEAGGWASQEQSIQENRGETYPGNTINNLFKCVHCTGIIILYIGPDFQSSIIQAHFKVNVPTNSTLSWVVGFRH